VIISSQPNSTHIWLTNRADRLTKASSGLRFDHGAMQLIAVRWTDQDKPVPLGLLNRLARRVVTAYAEHSVGTSRL
jgi:hypothetical protein